MTDCIARYALKGILVFIVVNSLLVALISGLRFSSRSFIFSYCSSTVGCSRKTTFAKNTGPFKCQHCSSDGKYRI